VEASGSPLSAGVEERRVNNEKHLTAVGERNINVMTVEVEEQHLKVHIIPNLEGRCNLWQLYV
jgi:hypothetical protein